MSRHHSFGVTVLCAMAWFNASAANSSYNAVPASSKLEFIGTQAGADFTGTFRAFSASVDIDPMAPEQARIDVQIQLASVDSKDKDRDNIIRGPDIFDTTHFPVAHYLTRSVAKSGTGYTALGALTLRGVTKDVAINFQFVPGTGSAQLIGTAQLKRLDFGAGQGDWKSTEWVGDPVRISFSLMLNPKQ
jgi:polyisoprenoid-binding protein YceI